MIPEGVLFIDIRSKLERIRNTDEELQALKEFNELQQQRARGIKSSMPTSEVVTGGIRKTMSDHVDEYIDNGRELDARIAELDREKMEVIRLINKLESGTLRVILIERYINRKQWDDVAKIIDYEPRQTFNLHQEALWKLEKTLH